MQALKRTLSVLALLVAAACGIAPGISGTPPPHVDPALCGSGLFWNGGDEESPVMHPGGDCISCHRSGEGPRLAVAGTVMTKIDDATDCVGVPDVQLDILDPAGAVVLTLMSNDAGNFLSDQLVPASALPFTARLTHDGKTTQMSTPQTDLNCMSCHTAAGAHGAPGRIVAP